MNTQLLQQLEQEIQSRVSEEVTHYGITAQDIAKLIQNLLKEYGVQLPSGFLHIDASYLYTWDISDLPYIYKETNKIRTGSEWVLEDKRAVLRNPLQVAWHEKLERWMNDQTVYIRGRRIKPLQIERSFDKVPNEALGMVTAAFTNDDDVGNFIFGAIGDGGLGTQPTPGDTDLVHEIDRINTNESPDGGASTVDGTTYQCVANYSKGIDDFDASESGVLDTAQPTNDRMLDHSIFKKAVPHFKDQNAPGATTLIFACSA